MKTRVPTHSISARAWRVCGRASGAAARIASTWIVNAPPTHTTAARMCTDRNHWYVVIVARLTGATSSRVAQTAGDPNAALRRKRGATGRFAAPAASCEHADRDRHCHRPARRRCGAWRSRSAPPQSPPPPTTHRRRHRRRPPPTTPAPPPGPTRGGPVAGRRHRRRPRRARRAAVHQPRRRGRATPRRRRRRDRGGPPSAPPTPERRAHAPDAARARRARVHSARAAAAQRRHDRRLRFGPAAITVHVGDTITWTNADAAPHTATADDGSFDTGTLARGQSGSHTFTSAGTFAYHCTIHPSMRATVKVARRLAAPLGRRRRGAAARRLDAADAPPPARHRRRRARALALAGAALLLAGSSCALRARGPLRCTVARHGRGPRRQSVPAGLASAIVRGCVRAQAQGDQRWRRWCRLAAGFMTACTSRSQPSAWVLTLNEPPSVGEKISWLLPPPLQ